MARTLVGTVVSDKADKTIVIAVQTRKTHPIYKKQYSVTTKFMAHDEKNEAQTGDKVTIVETRPISARKSFVLKNITETAKIRSDQTVDALTKDQVVAADKAPKSERTVKSSAKNPSTVAQGKGDAK